MYTCVLTTPFASLFEDRHKTTMTGLDYDNVPNWAYDKHNTRSCEMHPRNSRTQMLDPKGCIVSFMPVAMVVEGSGHLVHTRCRLEHIGVLLTLG